MIWGYPYFRKPPYTYIYIHIHIAASYFFQSLALQAAARRMPPTCLAWRTTQWQFHDEQVLFCTGMGRWWTHKVDVRFVMLDVFFENWTIQLRWIILNHILFFPAVAGLGLATFFYRNVRIWTIHFRKATPQDLGNWSCPLMDVKKMEHDRTQIIHHVHPYIYTYIHIIYIHYIHIIYNTYPYYFEGQISVFFRGHPWMVFELQPIAS